MFDQPEEDDEGRVVVLDIGTDGEHSFYISCVYTPNAGGDLGRYSHRVRWWDIAFEEYMASL